MRATDDPVSTLCHAADWLTHNSSCLCSDSAQLALISQHLHMPPVNDKRGAYCAQYVLIMHTAHIARNGQTVHIARNVKICILSAYRAQYAPFSVPCYAVYLGGLQYGDHARLLARVIQRASRASFAQRRQQGSSAETSTKGALQLLPAWPSSRFNTTLMCFLAHMA